MLEGQSNPFKDYGFAADKSLSQKEWLALALVPRA